MSVIAITGSQGFIGSYLCQEFLTHGYKVIGIDNYSKYGRVVRTHDTNPMFNLLEYDLRYGFPEIDVDYIIAGAAMIGGISYFHKYAYDLLASNERILANTFDFAIRKKIKRIVALSSSMVFENTENFPTKEEEIFNCPPPNSSYGFQKLSVEYFAKAAYDQYGLEYSIARPFNCVGVGEDETLDAKNDEMMLSHVLPDLIRKVKSGQYPIEILGDGAQIRCYTNGRDIARGIRLILESEKAINQTYNISTAVATSVIELLEAIWRKIGKGKLQYTCIDGFTFDVKKRIPDVSKASLELGFTSEISLEESIDEVIKYMS